MADMGISFISSHTVGLELATGKLVILDVVGLPIIRDWYVIHLHDKKLAPIPVAFRAFLLEQGARIIQTAVGDSPPRHRRA
jgi:DNA-binding transcriptional LysR family regulator